MPPETDCRAWGGPGAGVGDSRASAQRAPAWAPRGRAARHLRRPEEGGTRARRARAPREAGSSPPRRLAGSSAPRRNEGRPRAATECLGPAQGARCRTRSRTGLLPSRYPALHPLLRRVPRPPHREPLRAASRRFTRRSPAGKLTRRAGPPRPKDSAGRSRPAWPGALPTWAQLPRQPARGAPRPEADAGGLRRSSGTEPRAQHLWFEAQ